MELFNKLASNNTTEGGDIENKIMHRILTAKEDLELDGNKEGHYSYCNMEQFLQDADGGIREIYKRFEVIKRKKDMSAKSRDLEQ